VSTIANGTSASLTATGLYSDNSKADVTALAAWSSTNDNVATVAAGLVSAHAPGTVTITASLAGVTGIATVTVGSTTVVSIQVTPPFANIAVGAQAKFDAVATLSDGTTQDVTQQAMWTSSDPSVATVVGGVATGIAPGGVAIGAHLGNVAGFAKLGVSGATLVSITITPVNPTVGVGVALQFTATGNYSDGTIADLTAKAAWTSSAPGTVAVGPGGAATSLAAGSAIITATVGNVTGQTLVTVSAATLVSITINPASSQLPINATEKLIAIGAYSDGNMVDLTATAAWTSSDGKIAAVSNAMGTQGEVTGIGAGTATITAAVGKVVGTAIVTVSAAKLVAITISPSNPTVPKGANVNFTAKGTYSDGSSADITAAVAWSTDNGAVATISNAMGSNGVATAIGQGSTGVHATLDGVNASTTITSTADLMPRKSATTNGRLPKAT